MLTSLGSLSQPIPSTIALNQQIRRGGDVILGSTAEVNLDHRFIVDIFRESPFFLLEFI